MNHFEYFLALLITFCSISLNAQITPFSNSSNIFGEYHLVINQSSPYSESGIAKFNPPQINQNYKTLTYNQQIASDDISGSGSATSDDGTVTITYKWERLGALSYKIYFYNGGTLVDSETITNWIFGIDTKAKSEAKTIANKIAQEQQSAPIGEPFILIGFGFLFILYKYKNEQHYFKFKFLNNETLIFIICFICFL